MSLAPMEIQGVRFFNDAPSCISHFEESHWTRKAISLIQSFGTFLAYALCRIILVLRGAETQMGPLTNTDTHEFSNRRLVVCIHGLNRNPSQFKEIVDEMQQYDLSETDIFIPHVLQRGNAALDELVQPIFEKIAAWAGTSSEKELVLVGISNGGRISRALDAKIAQSEIASTISKLRFVSIVGACKGSSLVNLANRLGLSWLMSKIISEEMSTDSPRSQQLNQEWTNGLSQGPERDYVFIASPHDWQVPDYESTLMEVGPSTARYAIVPGHGHNSIVNTVARSVAAIALQD